MACGNAVIATDVGLTKKIVTPDVGLCISATPKSLVEAIEYLLSNIEKTSMMGIAARRKVMSEHTIEKYINYIRKKIV
jgi:glycosyltransferase involved in cell wall biosynthesis